jgi:hypothetical protein
MWEGEFVQTPIQHRNTIFGSGADFWDRFNASIDVWCSTGQPVTEYFLTPYLIAESLRTKPYEALSPIDDLYNQTSLDPKYIRPSQQSYSTTGPLPGGEIYTVDDNIQWLVNNPGKELPVKPIRVFIKQPYMNEWGPLTKHGYTGNPINLANGEIYTIDHRRWISYLEAGRDSIPIQWVTDDVFLRSQRWKFDTLNEGISILPKP